MTSAEVSASLELVEIKPGVKFSKKILSEILPDIETLLFFCKLYDMDHVQVTELLRLLFRTSLVDALTGGSHSTDLQSYVVDLAYQAPNVEVGDCTFEPVPPSGEILPEIWKDLETTVAKSIKDVAAKLESVVTALPGKQGKMMLQSMMVMNRKRPTIGDYKAKIHHDPIKENLLVLDVSGSMSESTIRQIINDVVALSYEANAHMAVVSNTTTYWTPGSYSVDDVLAD